ncbi:hypothetical protein D9M68_856450 [compost metagenome]
MLTKRDVLANSAPGQRGLAAHMKSRGLLRQESQATVASQCVARQHVDAARQMHQPAAASQCRSPERTEAARLQSCRAQRLPPRQAREQRLE